jgi:hypothetical protein
MNKNITSFTEPCNVLDKAAGKMKGAKFIGSGEDNNNVEVWYTKRSAGSVEGEILNGYHVGEKDVFSIQIVLVSYAPATKKIYLTMELEYLEGIVGKDTQETLLDISACGGTGLKISQAGETNSTSGKLTFTENGVILVAKGHLHVSFFVLMVRRC